MAIIDEKKMAILDEKDLIMTLNFPNAKGKKFDNHSHGLSHCMKAVDFVIELEDRFLFIEFKDPDHPRASQKQREEFLLDIKKGKLIPDLVTKFRDSFLYEWGSGRAKKPIYYFVLIAMCSLSPAELLAATDRLKRELPVCGPNNRPWKKPFVAGCAIMNIKRWNKALGCWLRVERLSQSNSVPGFGISNSQCPAAPSSGEQPSAKSN